MMLDTVWSFKTPETLKFGRGAAEDVGYEATRMGAGKALVVTDEVIRQAGAYDKVRDSLQRADLEVDVWDRAEPEPSVENFEDCCTYAQGKGFDVIILLGGGSAMDVGKVTSMLLRYGGQIEDYIAPPMGKGGDFPGRGLPKIAIPTTAGTGSEVSPAAIVSLPKMKLKAAISTDYQRPEVALVDPLMTISAPPKVTASSGVDALVHAIESHTARRYSCKPKPADPSERPVYGGGTPVTDLFAEKAIQLIGKYLRRAVDNGYDIEAREAMSLASLLAGIAFTNAGLGAVHAMEYPIGFRFHAAHGLANAVLLPYVMKFNVSSVPERYARIAELLGERTDGLSLGEASERAVIAAKNLNRDIGIPSSLKVFGCRNEDIQELAQDTLKMQRLLVGNPRQLTIEDLEKVFREAIEGELH